MIYAASYMKGYRSGGGTRRCAPCTTIPPRMDSAAIACGAVQLMLRMLPVPLLELPGDATDVQSIIMAAYARLSPSFLIRGYMLNIPTIGSQLDMAGCSRASIVRGRRGIRMDFSCTCAAAMMLLQLGSTMHVPED